ncbi:MAG: 2-dehydropantoate 2-reductase [Actinocatenispora sp.]
MRFIVYGAGAIGGALGARLHQAGHEVVLIARGPHLAEIGRSGLRVQDPGADVTLPVPAVGGPDEIDWRPDDVVLLTMKSNGTRDAVRALADVADPGTAVACVQNGVGNEPEALRHFANVYGVCVMMPAGHLTPGVVQAYSTPVTGILDIGRYPTGVDDTARRIAAAFTAATFVSEARPDVMRWKYRKFLGNLANAVDAATREEPAQEELVALLRAEGEECLRAAGIDPVSTAEDIERRGDIMTITRFGDAPMGSSTWQSLQRGSGWTEAEHLNGEVVLLGRLHGVATPANELVLRTVNRMARERLTPRSLSSRDLLDELLSESSAG